MIGHWHLEYAERHITLSTRQERHRHVIDRHTAGGDALRLAAMCVSVQHQRDLVTVEWFLEAAGAEKWIDLERLAFDGLLNRRVVQQGDDRGRAQLGQRLLEF